MRPAGGGLGGQDGGPRPPSSSSANGGERVYAHISDLRQQALSGYNSQGSIPQLLQTAEVGLGQAKMMLDLRRPDLSYVEYLRAYEIVVEELPRHRSWPDFQLDRDGSHQRYNVLLKKVNGQTELYMKIKADIVENNERNGVRPRGSSVAVGQEHAKVDLARINGGTASRPGTVGIQKARPSPSPKPEKLHGRAISTNASSGTNGEGLSERFARLRLSAGGVNTTNLYQGSNPIHASPISMPNASDFRPRQSIDSPTTASASSIRPLGPRGMPGSSMVPGKLPLDTSMAASMPKAPSPTYSPARNMQISGDIAPPRHSARSLASTSTRRASTMSSSSVSAANGYTDNDQSNGTFSPASNGVHPSLSARRKSVHVPKESRISAQKLYDYLIYYRILLIDFRPREEFDQGHVYFRSIINIDPFTLSAGMSAHELLERMILSPDQEQEMFMDRDSYDLVVYYDASTQSDTYLTHPANESETKLKHLHESLYEFNQDKPLQRPPILLIGGIDAWADLVGQQALATSNTAARGKQGAAIQRRPLATSSGGSQLRVPRRRLRDYNPLDEDEEKKWRERARAESVVLPPPPAQESDVAEEDEDDSKSAIKDFLERFPDAGTLDTRSFPVGQIPPNRTPPEIPAKVPVYPPTPPPSHFPVAPTRPKPAAPRQSYTGVSERSSSQNVPVPRSTKLAPYVPPKYLATNLRLPKTGLQNFGQTCYMNATIQALSATTPLSIFFLDDRFKFAIQLENWKGTKGVMPELYSNLIRSLWKGDVDYIRPSTFRKFCGRLKSEWGSNEQQDAKEFFDFVVDCLHEDFNTNWAGTPLQALTPQKEAQRERMPKLVVAKTEWARYTHREQSFLTDLFGGQHLSRLQCRHCGWTSTTYEAFYSISVEIPSPKSSSSQLPTLDDCLRSYCQEELLTGDDRFKCEGKCQTIREGTKQILITRVPQFLVIHFKRFSTNAYGRSASKIRTPVDFPLRDLNLEPYVLPPPSREEAQRIVQGWGEQQPEACMTPPYSYDAYAVVRHIGATMQSGHYTVAVKDRARSVWRYFNDERAEDFEPGQQGFGGQSDLRNDQAYIVFYQRNAPEMSTVGAPAGKI